MAFRAKEATEQQFLEAKNYMTRGLETAEQKKKAEEFLETTKLKLGNCIRDFPIWHPLADRNLFSLESVGKIEGLDHTIKFSSGLISCPYGESEKQKILESLERMKGKSPFVLQVEELKVNLYNIEAKPVMIYCDWDKELLPDGTIPLSIALPLLLESQLPYWKTAQVAEPWERMQTHFLGTPCGKRSSSCINQETGIYLKKTWEMIINSGMYGPIYSV